jgi:large subunit ribosomal protein L23
MQFDFIKEPIITEKTTSLIETQNIYTFKVEKTANKNQLREVVEKLFDVKVISVNTKILPGKTKKTGKKRLKILTNRFKYALFKLKEGQKISLFDTGESK